ncbi:hypothetical protein ACHAW6_008257 [Cyclotella cf. meneghiniana]
MTQQTWTLPNQLNTWTMDAQMATNPIHSGTSYKRTTASINLTGSRYIRETVDWDYKKQEVHLSMPGYHKMALKHF